MNHPRQHAENHKFKLLCHFMFVAIPSPTCTYEKEHIYKSLFVCCCSFISMFHSNVSTLERTKEQRDSQKSFFFSFLKLYELLLHLMESELFVKARKEIYTKTREVIC